MKQILKNNEWLNIYVSRCGVRVVDVIDNDTTRYDFPFPEVANDIPTTSHSLNELPQVITGCDTQEDDDKDQVENLSITQEIQKTEEKLVDNTCQTPEQKKEKDNE